MSDMITFTNQVIELFAQYCFSNPINSIDNHLIYFKPQKKHKNRVGLVYSEIQYATHFITAKQQATRFCDASKIRSLRQIEETIRNADVITHYSRNGEVKCHIGKRFNQNNHIIVVGLQNPSFPNHYKVITFMPNLSETQFLKKTTPI